VAYLARSQVGLQLSECPSKDISAKYRRR